MSTLASPSCKCKNASGWIYRDVGRVYDSTSKTLLTVTSYIFFNAMIAFTGIAIATTGESKKVLPIVCPGQHWYTLRRTLVSRAARLPKMLVNLLFILMQSSSHHRTEHVSSICRHYHFLQLTYLYPKHTIRNLANYLGWKLADCKRVPLFKMRLSPMLEACCLLHCSRTRVREVQWWWQDSQVRDVVAS